MYKFVQSFHTFFEIKYIYLKIEVIYPLKGK